MKFVFDDKISCMIAEREISQMNKEALTSGTSPQQTINSQLTIVVAKTKE